MSDSRTGSAVLRNKRDATRYRILVEVAERQPAVSQREIADAVGVTAQAVSEHLSDLVDEGAVSRGGRGRYEVTKEGVDWLTGQTDALREYVDHVSTDVLGDVAVETALATAEVTAGQRVTLSMRGGVLRATPTDGGAGDGGATAAAVTDAAADEDVGVTDFEGLIDYDLGTVTAVVFPPVAEGGSRALDPQRVRALAADHPVVAVAGTEALAAARAADVTPDVRFGTVAAVEEATTKGLDVLLLTVAADLSAHTDRLRETGVAYEVVDATTTDR
ncbi:DUF7839 domain-containing protein [Candidatus Halobonum tyrrellensis]|uniref:Regulatory protein Crp n=1 Tax=Candidatus Halobonum tyrrellensis G22 TaxID=1324957 RepID=V4HFV4_9EURY|nr:winged helix-turn-helix transcriptional regulator [Candidatus Halobonum tyrrellensis]ESP88983.1 regulatory protein Crp [Candidatus Halobonum tyrrellensis G22]